MKIIFFKYLYVFIFLINNISNKYDVKLLIHKNFLFNQKKANKNELSPILKSIVELKEYKKEILLENSNLIINEIKIINNILDSSDNINNINQNNYIKFVHDINKYIDKKNYIINVPIIIKNLKLSISNYIKNNNNRSSIINNSFQNNDINNNINLNKENNIVYNNTIVNIDECYVEFRVKLNDNSNSKIELISSLFKVSKVTVINSNNNNINDNNNNSNNNNYEHNNVNKNINPSNTIYKKLRRSKLKKFTLTSNINGISNNNMIGNNSYQNNANNDSNNLNNLKSTYIDTNNIDKNSNINNINNNSNNNSNNYNNNNNYNNISNELNSKNNNLNVNSNMQDKINNVNTSKDINVNNNVNKEAYINSNNIITESTIEFCLNYLFNQNSDIIEILNKKLSKNILDFFPNIYKDFNIDIANNSNNLLNNKFKSLNNIHNNNIYFNNKNTTDIDKSNIKKHKKLIIPYTNIYSNYYLSINNSIPYVLSNNNLITNLNLNFNDIEKQTYSLIKKLKLSENNDNNDNNVNNIPSNKELLNNNRINSYNEVSDFVAFDLNIIKNNTNTIDKDNQLDSLNSEFDNDLLQDELKNHSNSNNNNNNIISKVNQSNNKLVNNIINNETKNKLINELKFPIELIGLFDFYTVITMEAFNNHIKNIIAKSLYENNDNNKYINSNKFNSKNRFKSNKKLLDSNKNNINNNVNKSTHRLNNMIKHNNTKNKANKNKNNINDKHNNTIKDQLYLNLLLFNIIDKKSIKFKFSLNSIELVFNIGDAEINELLEIRLLIEQVKEDKTNNIHLTISEDSSKGIQILFNKILSEKNNNDNNVKNTDNVFPKTKESLINLLNEDINNVFFSESNYIKYITCNLFYYHEIINNNYVLYPFENGLLIGFNINELE